MNYSLGTPVVLILVLSSLLSRAQTISNSPYSLYGVGTLQGKSTALNRSLSATGIAVRDPLNLNTVNPASNTSIEYPTQIFEAGFFVEAGDYYTEEASTTYGSGNVTSLNAWFRFSRRWAGTVGIAPFSNMDYTISSRRRIGTDGGSSVTYWGNGGLSQFYFGNGFQVTKNLSVGVTGSFIFGSLNKNEEVTSGLGTGIILTDRTYINAVNLDFGAQYTFFFKENTKLTVGIIYDDHLRLNTSSKRYALRETDTIYSNSDSIDDYTLPSRYGAGLAFATPRSLLATDITFAEWSSARVDDDTRLRDTFGFSMGYRYKGDPDADTYWGTIQLSTGIYYRENYLVLENQAFADWGWSAAIAFPVSGNLGTVNLSYNHNETGTLNNGLMRYRNHVFSIDVTFRDLWGMRRRYD